MIIVVMGVTGSGKSTLASALSEKLKWPLYEGDDFHPPGNIEKMSAGIPLTDEDRLPWLAQIAKRISDISAKNENGVFTCSALKRNYRDILKKSSENVLLVYLYGSQEYIKKRHAKRKEHFMPTSLVESQFEILEKPSPEEALHINAEEEITFQVNQVVASLSPA